MAGIHADRGDKTHRLISGEAPAVGMWCWDNNLDPCEIIEVRTKGECGWYCDAWHKVRYSNGSQNIMNCERLTTVRPRVLDYN